MTDHQADLDQRTAPQYACIRTGGGEYVIYDQQNPAAWIQSDTTDLVTESI